MNAAKNARTFRQPNAHKRLRFSPTAWAKLIFLRDLGDTEVGGFGISSQNDLLLVEDVCLVKQRCSALSVKFDDESVADYFDAMVDAGYSPERFARLWIHTHPGDSPRPSLIDEETFSRCFGNCDWAVMFILAQEGSTYARLAFNSGPGGSISLPTGIAYEEPFWGTDHDAWEAEYHAHVGLTDVSVDPSTQLDAPWEEVNLVGGGDLQLSDHSSFRE